MIEGSVPRAALARISHSLAVYRGREEVSVVPGVFVRRRVFFRRAWASEVARRRRRCSGGRAV
jgi:hypothetical protein